MRIVTVVAVSAALLAAAGCSSNIDKGDDMIAQGKPEIALKYYQKAAEQNPKDPVVSRKIALANIELATMVIPRGQLPRAKYCLDVVNSTYPGGVPDDLKKELAEATARYAEGLKRNGKLVDALPALEKAQELDPDNERAKRVLEESKVEYAEILLQRAQDALTGEEYGIAEWNALKSLEYNSTDDARKVLTAIRKQGLDSYDRNEDICLAVSGLKRYSRKAMFMMYVLNNYQDDYFTVKPEFFTLYDKAGRAYGFKRSNYAKISRPLGTKEIKPGPIKISEASGALVFSIPRGAAIQKVVFDDGKGHKVEKYFP